MWIKATELIRRLEAAIAEHGDWAVVLDIMDEENGVETISSGEVTIHPELNGEHQLWLYGDSD